MAVKRWLMVIRGPFLLLPIALAFLGTSIAWWYDGVFHLGHALLAFLGLLLAHISVNALNEYFDYKSGVDLKTQRTPFSGGSGALPDGLVSAREALWLGWGSLIAIVPIGIYFTLIKGWQLFPLLIIAAICIIFYTPVILKHNWPEWAPGVGLGALPVLGIYFAQTGEYTLPAIIASIIPGILVHNLLLLNEFPDMEADATVNRKTLPITIGPRKAGIVYSALMIMMYVWIIGAVIAGQMPAFTLIALLTLPAAVKAIQGARNYSDPSKLIPGMANNVMVVLLTQVLMGIGYILARIF
ncbi:MAG: prenyltransferase [Chloroflexi bacterium]|nr:prenyltransferase [Chloroflexota bacterium]